MTPFILKYAAYLLLFFAVLLLTVQLYPEEVKGGEEEDVPKGTYRAFRPLIKQVATYNRRLKLQRVRERYRKQIDGAGLSYDITSDDFFAIKELVLLLFVGLGLLGYYNLWRDPTIIVVSAIIGFLLPDLKLRDLTRSRSKRMLKALPNFLDLLTLSVEAGLDFVGAIRKVAERATPGPLLSEFRLMLKEIAVGVTRRQALVNMSRKLDLADFTSFVSAVTQADEAGASLGGVLRIQADEMRRRRFQRAEKLAGQAPVKMLFPLVAFIFPATFIMVLGPLVFQLMHGGVF